MLSGSGGACPGPRCLPVGLVSPVLLTIPVAYKSYIFRAVIFYPMSALVTIFCSILQTPLDPRSRDDLDRMKMAAVMMARIFSKRLPEGEAVHFKLVADFVAELTRLAECAIDKAWREQGSDSLLPQ